MRREARALALVGLLIAGPCLAATSDRRMVEFLSPRGCVMGPGIAADAAAAGISRADLETFATRAASVPGSYLTGYWLVVSPDLCRITIPPVESELSLDDPEVKASFTDKAAHADEGFPGCFLDDDLLWAKLRVGRGWTREHAFAAYLQLVGAGVRSGALSFHSADAGRPPPGFVLTTGPCGEVPGMDVIRADHALFMRHLDGLIRDTASAMRCVETDVPVNSANPDFMARASHGRYRNAWGWWELMSLGHALGWYEGTSLTRNGVPQPPLCRFQTE